MAVSFFYPDYTVDSGVSPDHAPRSVALVGYTTDRELRREAWRAPCPEGKFNCDDVHIV